jgi:hypothetical protein
MKWLGLSGWVSQVDNWAPVHRNTTTHRTSLRPGIEALTSCQADAVDVAVVEFFSKTGSGLCKNGTTRRPILFQPAEGFQMPLYLSCFGLMKIGRHMTIR